MASMSLILLFASAWQSLSLISCTSKVLKDDCLKEPQLPPFLASVFQFLGGSKDQGWKGPQGCYADGSYTPMVRSHNLHRKVIIFHYGVSGGEGDRNLYEEFRLRGWSVHQVPCALLPSCVGVCCWGGQVANCLLKKTLFPRSSLFIS